MHNGTRSSWTVFVQGDSAADGGTGTLLIKPHCCSALWCPEAMHAVAGIKPSHLQ